MPATQNLAGMSDEEVTITLSRDQALVLSHWLGTVMGTRSFDSIVDEDPAVWSALYRISGAVDAEPLIFARDYGQRLDEGTRPAVRRTRRRVRSAPDRLQGRRPGLD